MFNLHGKKIGIRCAWCKLIMQPSPDDAYSDGICPGCLVGLKKKPGMRYGNIEYDKLTQMKKEKDSVIEAEFEIIKEAK